MNRIQSVVLFFLLYACAVRCGVDTQPPAPSGTPEVPVRLFRVVHVFVALCDNKHQGIVPVPTELGNGQDPKNNLYWGALYGVDTFFKRSRHWKHVDVAEAPKAPGVIVRSAFQSTGRGKTVYVVMSGYDGRRMKAALADFLNASAGLFPGEMTLAVQGKRVKVPVGGHADMVCFVGHNGLMDTTPAKFPQRSGGNTPRCAVVLACRSQKYFAEPLRQATCRPLLMTTGLMAPEAYTLEAVLRSWAAGDDAAATREKAAAAYAKYQKCSLRAARRIFVTGADK